MPRYVLVAKFDSTDDIKTLHDDKDTLSVDTTILDADDDKKEVPIALSKTSDIVSSTVLTWNDSFQIQSKDSSGRYFFKSWSRWNCHSISLLESIELPNV